MVNAPEQWPWSSYRAMIREQTAPTWVDTRWLLSAFGQTETQVVQGYESFVAAGKGGPSPWGQLKHQMFLGTDDFVESMLGKVPAGRDLREIPQARSRGEPKPIAHYARRCDTRDEAIVAAYASGDYTMQQIGVFFGLHYSRISKIINAADHAKEKGKTRVTWQCRQL